MPTLYQLLDTKIHNELQKALHVASGDHTAKELNAILINVGSAVEVFLKEVIFNGTRNASEFAGVIDGLGSLGIAARDREQIHGLRDAYNDSKHDPAFEANLDLVNRVVGSAQQTLSILQARNLGRCNEQARERPRRRFWFGAMDDFLGGITEIHLMLPILEDEAWSPPIIDNIHVDIKAWDELKPGLIAAGLSLGPANIPAKFYKQYVEDEPDSLAMGIFEGDYRELLSILAPRAKNLDNLLPFLKRGNDPDSMRAAVLMASADVADLALSRDQDNLVREIASRAETGYGASADSALASKFAIEMAAALIESNSKVINAVTGPFWYEKNKYDQHEKESVYKVDSLGCCFMVDGRLLCLL